MAKWRILSGKHYRYRDGKRVKLLPGDTFEGPRSLASNQLEMIEDDYFDVSRPLISGANILNVSTGFPINSRPLSEAELDPFR